MEKSKKKFKGRILLVLIFIILSINFIVSADYPSKELIKTYGLNYLNYPLENPRIKILNSSSDEVISFDHNGTIMGINLVAKENSSAEYFIGNGRFLKNISSDLSFENYTFLNNKIENETQYRIDNDTFLQNQINNLTLNSTFNSTYNNILNQDCPYGYVVNGTYYNGTFKCIFIGTHVYNASNIVTVKGTLTSGNLASILVAEDGNTYNVSELNGVDPLRIQINFTGVTSFDKLLLRYLYTGSASHQIAIGFWDYNTNSYDESSYGTLGQTSGLSYFSVSVFDESNHNLGGNVSVQLRHIQNGQSSHRFDLDYFVLTSGVVSSTVEIDPLSFHRNSNIDDSGYNITGDTLFGNSLNISNGLSVGNNLVLGSAGSLFDAPVLFSGAGGGEIYLRSTGSPADFNTLGNFQFRGLNSNLVETSFAQMSAKSDNVTASHERGSYSFSLREDGVSEEALRISSANILGILYVPYQSKALSSVGLYLENSTITSTGTGINYFSGNISAPNVCTSNGSNCPFSSSSMNYSFVVLNNQSNTINGNLTTDRIIATGLTLTGSSGTFNDNYTSEFPNLGGTSNGINMMGNILLYHFNNQSAYGETDARNVANAIYDFSGNSNNGKVGNATVGTNPIWSSSGKIYGAYTYNGSQFIDLGTTQFIKTNQPFSISVWVYNDNFSKPYPSIFNSKTNQAEDWNLFLSNTTGYKDIAFGALSGFSKLTTGDLSLQLDTWYNIIVTYNGLNATNDSNYNLYLNGVKKTLTTASPYGSNQINSMIGSLQVPNNWFNGTIDELSIWNRELTLGEASNIYTIQSSSYNNAYSGSFTNITLPDNGAVFYSNGIPILYLLNGSSGTSGWFQGGVSATRFTTRTPKDLNYKGDYLSKLPTPDKILTNEGKINMNNGLFSSVKVETANGEETDITKLVFQNTLLISELKEENKLLKNELCKLNPNNKIFC